MLHEGPNYSRPSAGPCLVSLGCEVDPSNGFFSEDTGSDPSPAAVDSTHLALHARCSDGQEAGGARRRLHHLIACGFGAFLQRPRLPRVLFEAPYEVVLKAGSTTRWFLRETAC